MKPETKVIAGVKHFRIACVVCGMMVWTQKCGGLNWRQRYTCPDCWPIYPRGEGELMPKMATPEQETE